MAIASSLEQAAGQAFDNLQIRWLANGLKSAVTTFSSDTLVAFPQQQQLANPVSNWITVLSALGQDLTPTNVPIDLLTDAAEIVYRLCWMAATLRDNSNITTAQASFLLSRYNVLIGF